MESQAIVFCLPKNIMNVFDISDESFGNFMNVYVTTLKVKRVVFVNDNMYNRVDMVGTNHNKVPTQ